MRDILSRALREKWYIPLLILLAPVLIYPYIGLPQIVVAGDGVEYSTLAKNMLAGDGYTYMDKFGLIREPGYPMFLAIAYFLFGVENLQAIFILQLLLAGVVGALMYFFFSRLGHPYLGAFAGLSAALWPSIGIVADDVATETLFILFLTILFLIAQRIIENQGQGRHLFLWFGILCGCATLIRVQLIFFLPFLFVGYLLVYRPSLRTTFMNVGLAVAPFLVIIGSWMLFVHHHTGKFAITEGRQQSMMYVRIKRTEQLSYAGLTYFAYQYLKQSATGGHADDWYWQYEVHTLGPQYNALATTTDAVEALKRWSVATILARPGQFLYGGLIEIMKMNWIHHDYTDTINRYVRAGVFVALYSLVGFAVYQFFRSREWRIKSLMLLAFVFILYNWLVLSPFDTIPRYNIPYIQFYVIIGVLGIVLWLERRKGTKGR
jgi:4-amino-4-deoxy-L-arabinose transferase-like glycosyltransferase